ncbi:MAG: HAD-IIIA family hydrolase [Anaerolineales bacterium]|nr:HAD-IIIA family hydrolase [Anaerolineales bacterium]
MSSAAALRRPALFVDRDGVLNVNRADYVKSVAEVEFLPGALAAVARATRAGWPVVVITNQSIIGRGLVTAAVVADINAHIQRAVEAAGGRLAGIYVCPHAPAQLCDCRKPLPGLLRRAAAALQLDLARSLMVGDAVSDAQAGLAAGARAMLVRTGRGADQAPRLAAAGLAHVPVVADLAAAVETWLADPATKTPPG